MAKEKYIPHAWETVNCPFCNSSENKVHETFGPEFEYTYTKCLNCGLIYSSPRPKYDEIFLKSAYAEYYTFNPDYDYSVINKQMWDKELKEILKYDKQGTAIIDVGSCMGDFLNSAKQNYESCFGVEVSENMSKFTEKKLGIKVYNLPFLEIDFEEKFSCVHLSHIIEHVPNPNDWLQKVKSILAKDGILALSVPNMLSLDRRFKLFLRRIGLRKGNWKDNTRTPDHLFEPTIESTIYFLKNNGFKILEYYTYSRSDMDVSTLFGKIYNRKFMLGSNLRFFATI